MLDLFSKSFTITKKHFVVLLGTMLVLFMASFIMSMISDAFSGSPFLYTILTMLNYSVSFYLSILMIKLVLKVVEDKTPTFAAIKPSLQEFLRYWIISLFQMVFFLLTLFGTFGLLGIFGLMKPGLMELYKNIFEQSPNLQSYDPKEIVYGILMFLLFSLPAIIVSMRLQFAPYISIDRHKEAIPSLMKSYQITKGNLYSIILLILAIILLNVVGILFFVVGLLFTIPMTLVVIINFYRLLDEHYHSRD